MNEGIVKAYAGSLFHDIGKVVQRVGGVSGTHSKIGIEFLRDLGIKDKDILDCVQYHHWRELRAAADVSHYAYIAYIADNIASAAERRTSPDEFTERGWNPKMPLQSVFNLLNSKSERHYYRPITLDWKEGINFPQKREPSFDKYNYSEIVDRFRRDLETFELTSEYLNSLLELAEEKLSFVPSSTDKTQVADISLYDHMKLTAAIACCIYDYIQTANVNEQDYRRELLDRADRFYNKDFAIMYSASLSGIQDFIYTIHSENALKTLRARSFYLELFVENLIDEILTNIGLTRANLLYSGGGHFYMILPNTESVKAKLTEVITKTNNWLLVRFRAALYVSDGYCECSANQLNNKPQGAYNEVFGIISQAMSNKKLHKYSADDILRINNQSAKGRECRICKAVRPLSNDICDLCAAFIKLSGYVSKQYSSDIDGDDLFFIVEPAEKRTTFQAVPISESLYVTAVNKQGLDDKLKAESEIVRFYGKNVFQIGKNLSTKLWVADYCKEKEISKYAEYSEGINRIGVMRIDVDNLGTAFTSGFNSDNGKYNTISRTATFSRHMSMFFKRDINMLLHSSMREITVIYSGGDDMFLLGAWDDIINAAIDINNSFYAYTQGKLTLSAGIGIYPEKYPIHVMARETGELENYSKKRDEDGVEKNSVTLFTPDLCFSWNELANQVVDAKLALLKEFFKDYMGKGDTFLHQILVYLCGIEEEEKKGLARISLARYAYLLAKAEPETDSVESRHKYEAFSEQMYEWISDTNERRQLKAAIYLYIYSKRENSNGHYQQA